MATTARKPTHSTAGKISAKHVGMHLTAEGIPYGKLLQLAHDDECTSAWVLLPPQGGEDEMPLQIVLEHGDPVVLAPM